MKIENKSADGVLLYSLFKRVGSSYQTEANESGTTVRVSEYTTMNNNYGTTVIISK